MSDAGLSDATLDQHPLLVGSVGRTGVGWWGAICVIVTETSLFCYLLFAYLYDAVVLDGNWLPAEPPSLAFSLPGVLILIASSVAVWWAERGARSGAQRQLRIGFLAALLCGAAFVALQLLEWRSKAFSLRSDAYGSLFFTITGIHLAHLLAGLVTLLLVLVWSALGYFDIRRNAPVLIGAAYWHFVVVAGVAVFVVLYISPYLG